MFVWQAMCDEHEQQLLNGKLQMNKTKQNK